MGEGLHGPPNEIVSERSPLDLAPTRGSGLVGAYRLLRRGEVHGPSSHRHDVRVRPHNGDRSSEIRQLVAKDLESDNRIAKRDDREQLQRELRQPGIDRGTPGERPLPVIWREGIAADSRVAAGNGSERKQEADPVLLCIVKSERGEPTPTRRLIRKNHAAVERPGEGQRIKARLDARPVDSRSRVTDERLLGEVQAFDVDELELGQRGASSP